ncbi:MAG: UDP-N-acetylmuramoyl-L-alanyl-D-glutamate--2,6-diaminopimelate ligase [Chloroflexi bacterium]|nr:UDP-N-acetylmuramoyl-L-alanyl-D-glutamate--2,6-diaminopimelate ligase [Chloroflexota bacterium]
MTTEPTPPNARGDWREGLPPEAARDGLPAARAIRFDSRDVEPGDVFVCVVGGQEDGHVYAPQAVERGAVALVAQEGRGEGLDALGVPVVRVPDPRVTLAAISAAHEGHPAHSLVVIGVTGTDGKSTTSFLIHAALQMCGVQAGLLTTIESRIGDRVLPNPTRLTSQEAPFVQRMLAEMVEAGCTHAVIESTSIGLDLHRLDASAFDVAVFTNLTSDHLDYHGSMDHYRASKGRLFEMLDEPGPEKPRRVRKSAVVNRDDPAWKYFAARTSSRVVTYAVEDLEADVHVEDLMLWPDGATFALVANDEYVEGSIMLPGAYNVANATAAVTVAAVLRLPVEMAAAGIAQCKGVPGRMERIVGAPFDVVVDYAHTGAALRKAVGALREVVEGRVIAVFGCAGERARERRSGLGTVAAELIDLSILTDEDPRTEPSEAILEEIAQAMVAGGAVEGERFERIADRRAAIARAFELARPGDLVLIAGKGHESTIEYADGPKPWDDRAVAREEIQQRFGAPAE